MGTEALPVGDVLDGDADGGRHRCAVARSVDAGDQGSRDGPGIVARHHDGEFFAAQPCRDGSGWAELVDPRGGGAENLVADGVTETVVDGLEGVEVEAEDGQLVRAVVPHQGLDGGVQPPPVAQPGELVEQGPGGIVAQGREEDVVQSRRGEQQAENQDERRHHLRDRRDVGEQHPEEHHDGDQSRPGLLRDEHPRVVHRGDVVADGHHDRDGVEVQRAR